MRSVIRQVIFIATLLMLPRIVVAELAFICPCSVQSEGLTAITATAGVSNSKSTTSGDLRILIGTSPELPIGSRWINAYGYYPGTLNSGEEYPQGTSITTAFELPSQLTDQNTAVFALDLQELVDAQWITRDSVRLDPGLEIPSPELGGESVSSLGVAAIYFAGTPSIELLESGQATVRIPSIVNSSEEDINIATVNIGHFASGEFWGQPVQTGAKFDVTLAVPGMSSNANVAITGEYSEAPLDFPYTHIWLATADNRIVVWRTIETRNGEQMPSRNLSATSIDFIADSDGDGVSDFNESVAGTDPFDNESRTAKLTLDVMALYTPGVAQLYLDEPLPRIIQELEWANQAYINSGIDAELRLVGLQETNYTKSLDPLTAMGDLQDQVGEFVGIDSVRGSAGADMIVLFIEDDPEDGVCGFAIRSGDNTEGDFAFIGRSDVVAVVAADCGASILAHEFGHNFGLGHSVREESNRGTFVWSRGHGVDNDFVTIMAFQEEYNTSGADLQFFSTPTKQCGSNACGVDRSDQDLGADAALSIRTTMFQMAALSGAPPDADADGIINFEDSDDDNDGVADGEDAFPLDSSESVDTDNDGVGNNVDSDDDGDGVLDHLDAFPLDATRTGEGSSNSYLGRSYHMTNSQSPNLSETHIINSSGSAQAFTGTLYHKSGDQLGAANVALHAGTINSQGRVILSATDLQTLFNVEPWTGPAILDIQGIMEFDVMSKLSRNGRVTNTNCVRSGNAQNVEGSDSTDIAYVRFINDGFTAIPDIRGTLYDADGNTIGQPDAQFFVELGPREAVFKSQGSISNIIGSDWSGQASLVLSATYDNLRLMNLNFVNNEIYFNFSCYLSTSD
jgi:hypothetical protein